MSRKTFYIFVCTFAIGIRHKFGGRRNKRDLYSLSGHLSKSVTHSFMARFNFRGALSVHLQIRIARSGNMQIGPGCGSELLRLHIYVPGYRRTYSRKRCSFFFSSRSTLTRFTYPHSRWQTKFRIFRKYISHRIYPGLI